MFVKPTVALFDFDGVIADSNGAIIEMCVAFFEKEGLAADWDFIERAKTMPEDVFCRELAALPGFHTPAEELQRRMMAFCERFYGQEAPAKPGVKAWIGQLHGEGCRMCVLSATDEKLLRSALRRLDLERYFEDVVTPARVGGRGKSFPDIFLECARVFGVEDLSQMTLFDDSLSAIRTAASLGIRTVGVYDDASREQAEQIRAVCDRYILSFEELL